MADWPKYSPDMKPAGERVELDGEGAAERGAEVGHLLDVLPGAVAGCAALPVARFPDPQHGEACEGNAETRRGHGQVLTRATRALLFDCAAVFGWPVNTVRVPHVFAGGEILLGNVNTHTYVPPSAVD